MVSKASSITGVWQFTRERADFRYRLLAMARKKEKKSIFSLIRTQIWVEFKNVFLAQLDRAISLLGKGFHYGMSAYSKNQ